MVSNGIIVPLGKTVNEWGDFVKSKNTYKHKVTVKRPKKRKVVIDTTVDIEFIMEMGAMWAQAEKLKMSSAKVTNKKKYAKRLKK